MAVPNRFAADLLCKPLLFNELWNLSPGLEPRCADQAGAFEAEVVVFNQAEASPAHFRRALRSFRSRGRVSLKTKEVMRFSVKIRFGHPAPNRSSLRLRFVNLPLLP